MSTPAPQNRTSFFGVSIDPLTMAETLDYIGRHIEQREQLIHVVVNVAKLVYCQSNEELRDYINSCGLVNVDGAGIVLGARLCGIHVPERVTGIDLMYELLRLCAEKGYKPFLLGARQEVLEKATANFRKRFPALKIAGIHHGYFGEDEAPVAELIRESGADILFVAISSPKKEMFIRNHASRMGVPFIMGVGGSFDVAAEVTRRAPTWMQKAGAEWLYRLMQEPRRLFGRYFNTNYRFLGMILAVRLLQHDPARPFCLSNKRGAA